MRIRKDVFDSTVKLAEYTCPKCMHKRMVHGGEEDGTPDDPFNIFCGLCGFAFTEATIGGKTKVEVIP